MWLRGRIFGRSNIFDGVTGIVSVRYYSESSETDNRFLSRIANGLNLSRSDLYNSGMAG